MDRPANSSAVQGSNTQSGATDASFGAKEKSGAAGRSLFTTLNNL